MKKVMSVILAFAVVACIGVGFTGCDDIFTPTLDKAIIGTWVAEDSEITFREDGTVTATGSLLGSVSINGTYTVNNETSQVTITNSLVFGLSKDTVLTVTVEEDTLTATGGLLNKTTVFTRQEAK